MPKLSVWGREPAVKGCTIEESAELNLSCQSLPVNDLDPRNSYVQQIESALEAIADPLVWVDQLRVIQSCNLAFSRLVKQPIARLVGRDLAEVLPLQSQLPQSNSPIIDQCLQSLQPQQIACELILAEPQQAELISTVVCSLAEPRLRILRPAPAHPAVTDQLALASTQIGIWNWDLCQNIVTWNGEAIAALGIKPEIRQLSYSDWTQRVHPKDLARVEQQLQQAIATDQPFEAEYRLLHPNGAIYWLLARGQSIREAEQPVRMVGMVMDISTRKRSEVLLKLAEVAWQENQELLDTIMANLPGGVFRCLYPANGSVGFAYASDAYQDLLGLTPEQLGSRSASFAELLHPDDLQAWNQIIQQAQVKPAPSYLEYRVRLPQPDGSTTEKWLARTARFAWGASGEFVVDGVDIEITDRKQAEAALYQLNQDLEARVEQRTQELIVSLSDKEVLLKELHHRVKNNLQMIQSLLSLQARAIEDPKSLAVLSESQQRVKAMAMAHEKLYQSDSLAQIDFADYVQSLTRDLRQSYMLNAAMIELSIQVESLELPVDTVIPCGLIINELFSNAIKYAFPELPADAITPSFRLITVQFVATEQDYILTVADNGIGIPETVDLQTSRSLGLRLVNALTRQIRGTLELDRSVGTRFLIRFAKAA